MHAILTFQKKTHDRSKTRKFLCMNKVHSQESWFEGGFLWSWKISMLTKGRFFLNKKLDFPETPALWFFAVLEAFAERVLLVVQNCKMRALESINDRYVGVTLSLINMLFSFYLFSVLLCIVRKILLPPCRRMNNSCFGNSCLLTLCQNLAQSLQILYLPFKFLCNLY